MRCYDYSAYRRSNAGGTNRRAGLRLLVVAVFVAVAGALAVAAMLMTAALPAERQPPWVPGFSLLFTIGVAAAIVAQLRMRDALALLLGGLGATVGNALILAHGPFSNPFFGADAQTIALLTLPIGPALLVGAAIVKRMEPPEAP